MMPTQYILQIYIFSFALSVWGATYEMIFPSYFLKIPTFHKTYAYWNKAQKLDINRQVKNRHIY